MYIYMYIHNIYIYTYLIDSSTRQFRQNSVRLKLLLYSQLRHIALLERAASIFGTWASKRWGKFTFFEHKNGGWNMIFHGFSPLSIWENEVPWCSMSMFFSECKILKWTCFLVPSFFFPGGFVSKHSNDQRYASSHPFLFATAVCRLSCDQWKWLSAYGKKTPMLFARLRTSHMICVDEINTTEGEPEPMWKLLGPRKLMNIETYRNTSHLRIPPIHSKEQFKPVLFKKP